MERNKCWCGNQELEPFSPDYRYCKVCGTLVRREWPDLSPTEKREEYEKYWAGDEEVRAMVEKQILPVLEERARTYLIERGPYWLRTLLHYRLPPAKILEIGSGSGAFVGLMQAAGFDARGLEVQSWSVDLSSRWFQVPVLYGPIEEQHLPTASLDGVVMLDVLEHLTEPEDTLRRVTRLVKPEGFVLVQTPEFPEGLSYAEMQAQRHPFLDMFIPEHRYLFSRRAVQYLFQRVGLPWIQFEDAFFAHYDMFFVAAARPLQRYTQEEIRDALERHLSGRVVYALLDLWEQRRQWETRSAQLQQALEDAQAEVQHLQHTIADLQHTLADLHRALGECEGQVAHWRTDAHRRAVQAAEVLDGLQQSKAFLLLRRLGRWHGIEELLMHMAAWEEEK